jgi:hypothetical protein
MATLRVRALRKLHVELGQILSDHDASLEADRAAAAGGKGKAADRVLDLNDPNSNNLSTPESEGAQDAAPRRGGRTQSMAEAFKGFDRIKKNY